MWCSDPTKHCELSSAERQRRYCAELNCSGSNIFAGDNACGGDLVGHICGYDAYSETYHYNQAGVLVGVVVQAHQIPCHLVLDVYGEDCQPSPNRFRAECAAFDAGVE